MIRLGPKPRLLLVRPDKIGDVVLTTPAVAAVRERFPEAFVAFLCRSYAAPVLERNPGVDEILRCDEDGSAWALSRRLRKLRFDASLHFYLDGRCEAAAFLARIPARIGPFSKASALFLNRRVRQDRSEVAKHEAEYNLDLVRQIGADGSPRAPRVFLSATELERGREIVRLLTGRPDARPVVIHPGSAGSVQNWPLAGFLELGKRVADAKVPVIFTAGRGEEAIAERARRIAGPELFVAPAGGLSLRELAAVLAQARLVVSNSTGPLHIASALGARTLSFYPHRPKVTSAKRWGPFGDPSRNRILSPPGEDDPMSSISVQTAYESALKWIA